MKQATGNPHIYGYAYDLASLAQTRGFAEHVRRDVECWFGGKLHVLLNNAGVFEEDNILTEVRQGSEVKEENIRVVC